MRLSRYHACVFRAALIFLACLLVFGVAFSFLPSGSSVPRSGVTLQGVRFSLYPEQDRGAVWRFAARQVSIDPLKNENTLDDLGRGERWIKAKKKKDVWIPDANGEDHLDLTLTAKRLVIDADDNLKAREAHLYILQDCTTLTLRAAGDNQVVINQRSGYTAPYVGISSPSIQLEFDAFSSPFDLSNVQGTQRAGGTVQTNPTSICKNGHVVPRPA